MRRVLKREPRPAKSNERPAGSNELAEANLAAAINGWKEAFQTDSVCCRIKRQRTKDAGKRSK